MVAGGLEPCLFSGSSKWQSLPVRALKPLTEGGAVETLCQAGADRWSALLTKHEPAGDMPRGFNVQVTIFRDSQCRVSYSFRALKDERDGCTKIVIDTLMRPLPDVLACSVAKREAELVRLFVSAIQDLSRHLLEGGSVQDWVRKGGLPGGERKAPRSWRRRRPLVFCTEKEVFIWPW